LGTKVKSGSGAIERKRSKGLLGIGAENVAVRCEKGEKMGKTVGERGSQKPSPTLQEENKREERCNGAGLGLGGEKKTWGKAGGKSKGKKATVYCPYRTSGRLWQSYPLHDC